MIPYSLHLAILLTACWLFYKLLLQNETYYKLNRIILLVCLALSFLLPLIPLSQKYSLRKISGITEIADEKPAAHDKPIGDGDAGTFTKVKPTNSGAQKTTISLDYKQLLKWAVWTYWFGMAVFGLNFLVQLTALLYKVYKQPFIQDGMFRIAETDNDNAPCSFGRTIFINPEKYDWDTYNQILVHEKVHISQGHTVDLLLAELMLVVQWFNPFAWLYRKEIENNLEFLTDDSVINNHKVEPQSYQLSLVKVAAPNLSMRITTNYNQSLLKRRIMMMNAKKSNLHNIWKYCMLLPFLVLLLCIFNKPIQSIAKEIPKINISLTVGKKVSTASKDTSIKTKEAIVRIKVENGKLSIDTNKQTNNGGAIDVETLTVMSNEGITPAYIKSFKDIGYNYTSIETMRAFYNADITASYVKSFMDIRYSYISPETILAFYTTNITAGYIKSFNDIEYNYTSPETMIAFYNTNITAGYIKSFSDIRYTNTEPETMVAFYNTNITASYIKSFSDIHYKYTSPETMVTFYNTNITASYIKGFLDINYKYISPETIITFYTTNIAASYIKGFMDIKYPYITPESIISLYTNNITASYVKGMHDAGNEATPKDLTGSKTKTKKKS